METGRESYKRPFDLSVIAIAAVVLLPLWALLLVVIPLAIRLESRGPALYRQTRLGRGGRTFTLWKFRTIADGAERDTGPVWAAWRTRGSPVSGGCCGAGTSTSCRRS